MLNSELLEWMLERPAMYFGEKTLTGLWHFLHGYQLALSLHEVKTADAMRFPIGFHDWVAYKLGFKESTGGWCRMILSHYPTEPTAFEQFRILWESYNARVAIPFAKIERKVVTATLVSYDESLPGFFALPEQEDENSRFIFSYFPELSWLESFWSIKRDQLIITNETLFQKIVAKEA